MYTAFDTVKKVTQMPIVLICHNGSASFILMKWDNLSITAKENQKWVKK